MGALTLLIHLEKHPPAAPGSFVCILFHKGHLCPGPTFYFNYNNKKKTKSKTGLASLFPS